MKNHWTEDPERVEQFVAGSLPADQRQELERHLADCPSCSEAVAREQALRHGIRLYARDQLKDRLRTNINAPPVATTPWPHVLSAAAVVLVVLGLGVYNRWWIGEEPAIRETELQVGPPAGEAPADAAGGGETAVTASPLERTEEVRSVPRTASGPERDRALLMDDATHQPAAAARPSPVDQVEAVWIVGTVIGRTIRKDDEIQTTQRAAKQQAGKAEFRMKETTLQAMNISQEPLANLPSGQQRAQVETIVAAIEQRNDSLQITLFTDEGAPPVSSLPFDEVSDDSVVVSIDGMRVGLKIPLQLLQSQKKVRE